MILYSMYLGYITLDAGWKKTDDTDDTDDPDVTDGAIGVLVSTPFKKLMLLMFFMRMKIFLQFINWKLKYTPLALQKKSLKNE